METTLSINQTSFNKLEKLIEFQILNEISIDRYKQFIDEYYSDFSENTNLLIFLFNERHNNLSESFECPYYPWIQYKNYGDYDESLKNEIRNSFKDCLNKLEQIGLISEDMMPPIIKGINDKFISPYFLFERMMNSAIQKELFEESKVNQFLDELLEKDVISIENFQKVKKLTKAEQLKDYFDFIEYCHFSKKIDVSTYDNTPSVFLEKFCRDVASIMPAELNFSELKFEINWISGSYNKTTVSIKINEKIYKHTLQMWEQTEGVKFKYGVYDFHNLFNKALASQKSSYRLCPVIDSNSDNKDASGWSNPFCYIALTESQQIIFNNRFYQFYQKEPFASREPIFDKYGMSENRPKTYSLTRLLNPVSMYIINYQYFIPSLELLQIVNQFKETGIFDHLPLEDFENGLMEATNDEPIDEHEPHSWVLRDFEGVTCRVYYLDCVMDLDKPYKGFMQILSKISNGRFNPQNIIDEYDNEELDDFDFGFELNGKKYHTLLEHKSDHSDLRFMDLVQKAVKEQIKGGKFYFYDYGEYVIFLTPPQYKQLKKQKLIDFESKYDG